MEPIFTQTIIIGVIFLAAFVFSMVYTKFLLKKIVKEEVAKTANNYKQQENAGQESLNTQEEFCAETQIFTLMQIQSAANKNYAEALYYSSRIIQMFLEREKPVKYIRAYVNLVLKKYLPNIKHGEYIRGLQQIKHVFEELPYSLDDEKDEILRVLNNCNKEVLE